MSQLGDRPTHLHLHGHLHLFERILGLRRNFSAYDATYVALAERLAVELLTGDRPLGRAVAQQTALRVLADQ